VASQDKPTVVEQDFNDVPLDAEDHGFYEIWRACRRSSKMPFARALGLFRAIRYVHQNFLPGDIVDIGSADVGSVIVIAKTIELFGAAKRRLLLVSGEAESGCAVTDGAANDFDAELSIALADTGYESSLVFRHHRLKDLLISTPVQEIVLLRLDHTDERASSSALENLYPYLVDAGVVIVEQFGSSAGQRKAVDAYLDGLVISGQTRPFLQVSDETGRIGVKPADERIIDIRGTTPDPPPTSSTGRPSSSQTK